MTRFAVIGIVLVLATCVLSFGLPELPNFLTTKSPTRRPQNKPKSDSYLPKIAQYLRGNHAHKTLSDRAIMDVFDNVLVGEGLDESAIVQDRVAAKRSFFARRNAQLLSDSKYCDQCKAGCESKHDDAKRSCLHVCKALCDRNL
jgi:hypothetical protein